MSLDADVQRLSRVALFAELPPEAQRLMAFSAETLTLGAGEVLFERGQMADCAYLVLSGAIGFDAGAQDYAAGPDCLIGETALLTATERPATARAAQASTLMKISRVLFHRVMREFPDAAVRLHQRAGARLAGFTRELEEARQRHPA